MDGNKDEAIRCIQIAESAIASGNKQKALKFIKIAQRLNSNISVENLFAACEKIDSEDTKRAREGSSSNSGLNSSKPSPSSSAECRNGERNFTEENVKLIREVKRSADYYAILGVDKTCSVEEIKRAYKKLSLKVHPDKNKAPGSEEAFKKVCKAFKCLSEEETRRQYDQTGLVDEFEYNQQHNVRRRRRRTTNDFFQDDFDPDEIFRSFFGQTDVFRNAQMYRTRGTRTHQREEVQGGFNIMILIQLLPILIIFLLVYLPFSEPEFSLAKTYTYQYPKFTEKYGVQYYVKSPDFDQKHPPETPSRANIEDHVVREYTSMIGRYCHVELQRRQWNRNYPTPHCDKLRDVGVVF